MHRDWRVALTGAYILQPRAGILEALETTDHHVLITPTWRM